MAINNTVTLTGNMGSEAHLYETDKDGREFAALSLATTDSYQDDEGNWHEKETVWHNVLAFNPKVIAMLKGMKKGTRIQVEGSLSYRPYDVQDGDNKIITKKEASIIARKVEMTPLVAKPSKQREEA